MVRKKQIRSEKCEPAKCWVGEQQKVIYPDEETAELVARAREAECGLERGTLIVYRCEYGVHWHLANKKN